MNTAIVIGSGIGGLAAAIRLSVKGYGVTVYEKNRAIGGKVAEFSKAGFRFDMGPSLFTIPEYLEELFDCAGRRLEDYLTYHKLDHSCHYFFPDGTDFIFYHDRVKLRNEVNHKLNLSTDLIDRYLDESARLFNKSGRLFIEQSLDELKTYFSKQAVQSVPQLLNPKNLKSLHQKNQKDLKDEKWVQLFDRYATYNGSSPYKTSSMMSIIPHLEHNIGTFFPVGGMHAIIKALENLALELGVEFIKNTFVEHLNTANRKIVSVSTKEKEDSADIFVSNMDISSFYRYLLKDPYQFNQSIKAERSSSGLVFYWGINHTFPDLNLHNIFFSDDYALEFNEIFDQKLVPADPTIYVNISSKHNSGDAPKGMENWFVMINVPPQKINQSQIRKTRALILKKLSDITQVDIEAKIITEHCLSPGEISENTLALDGALYGAASNSIKSSFTRHSNFSKDYNNLYFVGGTVHPGGGIPLCLNSAKIVANSL